MCKNDTEDRVKLEKKIEMVMIVKKTKILFIKINYISLI
jgi:hypothetical protein